MMDQPSGKIFVSIPAIIAEVGPVGKSETNSQQGYKYRSADAVCDALHEALGKHKVFTTCEIIEREVNERESRSGGVLFYVNLKTRYTFHAEDGSSVCTDAWGEAMDSGDKATNKAMTAAYKYALLQVFCLMGHEDSETESPEVAPQPKRAPRPKCPECGKSEFVYENKQAPGFFCWQNEEKGKLGCGHKWEPPLETEAEKLPAPKHSSGDVMAQPAPKLTVEDARFIEAAAQSLRAAKSPAEAKELWSTLGDKPGHIKTAVHRVYTEVLRTFQETAT